MAYVKHPIHGNKHVADSEVPALVKDGWVKWPRTEDEKALGDGSDAAYWRKRYERDVKALGEDAAIAQISMDPADDPGVQVEHKQFQQEPPRRGRPPKA